MGYISYGPCLLKNEKKKKKKRNCENKKRLENRFPRVTDSFRHSEEVEQHFLLKSNLKMCTRPSQ